MNTCIDMKIFALIRSLYRPMVIVVMTVFVAGLSSSPAQAYDWRQEWEQGRSDRSFGPLPVFAEPAQLYAAPSENAPVLVPLQEGALVDIDGPSTSAQADNRSPTATVWWRARYTDTSGHTHSGYVHHAIFAAVRADLGDHCFLLGWTPSESGIALRTVTLKVFEGTRLVARDDFPLSEAMIEHSLRIEQVRSLRGLAAIVRVVLGAGQCGYPYLEYLYGWTGEALLPLPSLVSYGGEGIEPGYSVFMVVPEESPDTLIKLIRRDTPEREEPVLSMSRPATDYATVVYEWNGRRATARAQQQSVLDEIQQVWLAYYVDDAGNVVRRSRFTEGGENDR